MSPRRASGFPQARALLGDAVSPRPVQADASAAGEIALIVEEQDLASAEEVNDFLEGEPGIKVNRIKFSGLDAKHPSSMAGILASCGKCIVFWGAQSEEWLSGMLALDALSRYVGDKRLCVYGGLPASPVKTAFRTNRGRVIEASSASRDADLREFLASARTPA